MTFLNKLQKNPKAQEDAEKLRSVVMPMEQEIAALKSKLATAEERLKELEASKVGHLGSKSFFFYHIFLLYFIGCWAVNASLFFQVKELNHVLEAEKSCRTDLEMYVAVLNTQKSVLQEDAEKLRKELHDGTPF